MFFNQKPFLLCRPRKHSSGPYALKLQTASIANDAVPFVLIAVGQMAHTGWPYYGGILIAAGLSAYQQKLIFHREKALCFKTFLNDNWFGMAVFAGLAADYGLR